VIAHEYDFAPPGKVDLFALARRRPLTVADLPEEDEYGRTELIDGSLYVTPLGDLSHQRLVWRLSKQLEAMFPDDDSLEVFPGANVVSQPKTLVIPDVAVIRAGQDGLGASPADVVLVVEITSPSTRRRDLTIKRDLYREWGVPLLLVDRSTSVPAVSVHGKLPDWVGEISL
jgi:Uma2 family endonuclease